MRVLFDTSVLVAALVEAHPNHGLAFPWLEAALSEGPVTGLVATHGLAETWAVLTRLPLVTPLAPMVAHQIVERLARALVVLPADPDLYLASIERCGLQGLRSGAVFDALHLLTAERAEASALVTFNAQDFRRLATPESCGIQVPGSDPPPAG